MNPLAITPQEMQTFRAHRKWVRNIRISRKGHEIMAAMRAPGKKVLASIGGLGSAKSWHTWLGICELALATPNSQWCVATGTGPQLKRGPWREMLSAFEDSFGVNVATNRSDMTMVLPNGSTVYFISAQIRPREVKGMNLHGAVIDEADVVGREFAEMLEGRCRIGENTLFMLVANPVPQGHWVEQWLEQRKPTLISSTTYDNPFLPQESIERYHAMYPKGSNAYRRWVMGEMGVPLDGAVYPEFGQHLIRPLAEFEQREVITWLGGIDFGFNNPTCYLLAALDSDDVLWIVAEHYARRTLLEDHAVAIEAMWREVAGIRGCVTFADHDAQDRAELNALGVTTRNAYKNVGVGINFVRERLREERLRIIEGAAPNLVREMGSYVWAERGANSQQNARDVPLKLDDHSVDALRYIVAGLDNAEQVDPDLIRLVR